GLATQAGSLFVLHLNIFTMNNLAKQKPLTLSEASQTTEGLVQRWGLLLCWYFIMSSPEPQPIEKLMMKITTKADRIPSAGYGLIAI
uniref:hypothetical protein n=1 Tax=Terrimonas pollutisoli TaxID=3034147 RepID=UPI0023EAC305